MDEQALSDVKVLDVGHYIIGPYCTKLLGEFGAEVIKVERPGSGDGARRMGPFPQDVPHSEKSALFLYLNTGKKGITLDLKSDRGMKIFQELVKDADVLVENFEPNEAAALGLSWEVLKEINPKLIMTSISNFGHTGPYRDFKGTNLTLTALGGAQAITGVDPPIKLGGSQTEYMTGLMGFNATMGALLWRHSEGKGQHVDLSTMEVVAGNLEGVNTEYCYLGMTRLRRGQQMMKLVYGHPVGNYPCRDGWVVVIPGLGGMEKLSLLVEHPEYMEEELFVKRRQRQARPQEFDEKYLYPYLKEHDMNEIFHSAQELRMPFGVAQNAAELLEDEHLKAREFFVEREHPVAGNLAYPGVPFKLSETPCQIGRAPLLGEHNEEIYCQKLGYTKEELVRLRQTNVI